MSSFLQRHTNKCWLPLPVFKTLYSNRKQFECPICSYIGPFLNISMDTGIRLNSKCPSCGSLERHRIQFLTIQELFKTLQTNTLKILHFAPEPFFEAFFRKKFDAYESADLEMQNVDHKVDIQNMSLPSESYDFVLHHMY